MRNVMWALLVVAAACGGPSSQEIKVAKTTAYKAPLGQVFDAALDETQQRYKIESVDPANGRFATEPQFYAEDGTRLTAGAEGVVQNVRGGTILMHLVVEAKRLVDAPDERLVVVITPRTFEVVAGSPKPRELAPDDPNLPPFVQGRVDSLAIQIHTRLQPLAAPP